MNAAFIILGQIFCIFLVRWRRQRRAAWALWKLFKCLLRILTRSWRNTALNLVRHGALFVSHFLMPSLGIGAPSSLRRFSSFSSFWLSSTNGKGFIIFPSSQTKPPALSFSTKRASSGPSLCLICSIARYLCNGSYGYVGAWWRRQWRTCFSIDVVTGNAIGCHRSIAKLRWLQPFYVHSWLPSAGDARAALNHSGDGGVFELSHAGAPVTGRFQAPRSTRRGKFRGGSSGGEDKWQRQGPALCLETLHFSEGVGEDSGSSGEKRPRTHQTNPSSREGTQERSWQQRILHRPPLLRIPAFSSWSLPRHKPRLWHRPSRLDEAIS